MPITSSGQIALVADIAAEFTALGSTDVTLDDARAEAGLTAGEVAMTDFYGLSDAVAPSVATNSFTSVGSSSMTARGNVTSDGGGSITERGFYFGTNSASPTNNTKYTVSGTTGAYTRSMTGLSSGTTYYCWAFATNSAGTTYGGRVQSTTSYPTHNLELRHRYYYPNIGYDNFSYGYTCNNYTGSPSGPTVNLTNLNNYGVGATVSHATSGSFKNMCVASEPNKRISGYVNTSNGNTTFTWANGDGGSTSHYYNYYYGGSLRSGAYGPTTNGMTWDVYGYVAISGYQTRGFHLQRMQTN